MLKVSKMRSTRLKIIEPLSETEIHTISKGKTVIRINSDPPIMSFSIGKWKRKLEMRKKIERIESSKRRSKDKLNRSSVKNKLKVRMIPPGGKNLVVKI